MSGDILVLHKPHCGANRGEYNQAVALLMKTVISEGEERIKCSLDEDVESYLVFTLVRFLHGKDPFSITLALEFLRAGAQERGRQKEETLGRLGDTSLILDGFFPERARSLHVSREYFQEIGISAFSDLSEMLRLRKCFALAKWYERVGAEFPKMTEVLRASRQANDCTPL